MDSTRCEALLRSLSRAPSRRGLLAALTGGVLAAGPFALGVDEIAAKKKGQRKKRKNKKKVKNQPPPTSPPPGPTTRADAACSGPSTLPLDAGENERLAQTFTAMASGPLIRAELSIFKSFGSSGDYILHLGPVDAFGVPTNEVLAFTSVANASLPSSGVMTVTFTFANPATVVAGTQYALVLTRQGPGLTWVAHDGDLCGGQPFSSSDQTAPFASTPFGSSVDCIFTTFVTS